MISKLWGICSKVWLLTFLPVSPSMLSLPSLQLPTCSRPTFFLCSNFSTLLSWSQSITVWSLTNSLKCSSFPLHTPVSYSHSTHWKLKPWILPPFHRYQSISFHLMQLKVHVHASVVSDSLRLYGLYPTRLLCPWDSPGKNTGLGCHAILQGIFLTQGSNPRLLHLLHFRQILHWATWEAPKFMINH